MRSPQPIFRRLVRAALKPKPLIDCFEHKAVKMEAILSSHYHSTMERIAREKIPVVLAVQDTTSFNYDTHADMGGGAGPITKHVDGAQGILMHRHYRLHPRGHGDGLGRHPGLGA